MKTLITSCLVSLFVLLSSPAHSVSKTIISEGTYIMGDGETPIVAEARALNQAKRMALEQAGTYLESYSKSKTFQLTEDEIHALAAGILEVQVLEQTRTLAGRGIQFYVKIKTTVNVENADDLVARMRQRGASGQDFAESYQTLQREYDRLSQQIDTLKNQLIETRSDQEHQQALRRLTEEERKYQSRIWFEKGFLSTNDNDRIEYFGKAVKLDPDYAEAWYSRGSAYSSLGDYARGISDITEAIRVNPIWDYYLERGVSFWSSKKYKNAIADYTEVIRLNPNRYAYRLRGDSYNAVEEYSEAISDYDQATTLPWPRWFPKEFRPVEIAFIYLGRTNAYRGLKQYDKALPELSKLLQIKPPPPEEIVKLTETRRKILHLERGWTLYHAGNRLAAVADFQRACELGLEDGCEALRTVGPY